MMNVMNNHVRIKDLTTVENRKELFVSAHETTLSSLNGIIMLTCILYL